jgi:hypothetical protein
MSVDLYFLTNKYPVFLIWVQATRARLMALNQYRPGATADAVSMERIKNFLKTKELTDINVLKAKYEKDLQDKKITEYGQTISDISKNIKEYTIKEGNNSRKIAFDKIHRSWADRLKDRVDAEKIIADEMAGTIYSTVGDDGNPIPLEQRVPTNISETPEYLSTPLVFPSVGPEVTKAITDNILDPARTKYDFLEGGKKKTEQRGWIKQIDGVDTNASTKGNVVKPKAVDKTKFLGKPGAETSDYSKEILKNTSIVTPSGSYKFFIEKLHGRHYTSGAAEPYSLNPVTNQKEIYKENGINYSNRKVFAAFIDNYNDSYSVGWESYNFIGRGEKVYAYSSTERKITMEFTILTDHSIEQLAAIDQMNEKLKSTNENDILSFLLDDNNLNWGQGTYDYDSKARLSGGVSTYFDTPETTWQKVTFLAQCCYPYYRTDGKMKEQPMVRMRIGDFYDVICYINSLNYSLNTLDVPYIDFNKSSLGEQPMGIKVTIDAVVVHDYEPSSEYYGFYHRTQFDNNDAQAAYEAKVWGVGLSKNSDSVAKLLKKNSPLSIKNVLNIGNLTDLLTTTDFQEIQRDIKVFKDNFKGLQDKTTNLFDQVKKIKLKNIFDAIKSIKNHTEFFDALSTINDKYKSAKSEVDNELGNFNKVLSTSKESIDAAKKIATDKVTVISDKINHAKDVAEKTASDTSTTIKQATTNLPKTLGDFINKTGN